MLIAEARRILPTQAQDAIVAMGNSDATLAYIVRPLLESILGAPDPDGDIILTADARRFAIARAFSQHAGIVIGRLLANDTADSLAAARALVDRLLDLKNRTTMNPFEVRELDAFFEQMAGRVIGPQFYANTPSFGAISAPSALPLSMSAELLNSDCPFVPSKRIADTHYLAFFPLLSGDSEFSLERSIRSRSNIARDLGVAESTLASYHTARQTSDLRGRWALVFHELRSDECLPRGYHLPSALVVVTVQQFLLSDKATRGHFTNDVCVTVDECGIGNPKNKLGVQFGDDGDMRLVPILPSDVPQHKSLPVRFY